MEGGGGDAERKSRQAVESVYGWASEERQAAAAKLNFRLQRW